MEPQERERAALSAALERQDRRAVTQSVEMICPGLHHLSTVLKIHCLVVRSTYLVGIAVRELPFDPVTFVALFVEGGANQVSESVRGLATSEPKALE